MGDEILPQKLKNPEVNNQIIWYNKLCGIQITVEYKEENMKEEKYQGKENRGYHCKKEYTEIEKNIY